MLYIMTSSGRSLSFGVGSVVGVLAGAFAGSLIKGHFRWEACEDPRELRRQIIGAVLMGVGAIIALDRRIISTGYNGTPRGVRNCNEGGCPRCNGFAEGGTRLDECLCSHGEENAIIQVAYHGSAPIRGSTLYTTFCPCLMCTKMIINAGIAEVVYNADYPMGDVSLALLREAGVKVRQISLGAE